MTVARGRGRGLIPGLLGVLHVDGFFAPPTTDTVYVDQFVVEYAVDLSFVAPVVASPCDGDGAIAVAVDPADGTDVATARDPLVWLVVHLDSGDRAYSFEALPDPSSYYAGMKLARIISIGTAKRSQSDDFGGVITSRLDVRLLDHDRRWRTYETTETIRFRSAELFIADDATRIAHGTAKRIAFYIIDDYEPVSDLTFTLSLVDPIGSDVSSFQATKQLPPLKWPADTFAQLAQRNRAKLNTAMPIYYGSVSDEALGESEGAAPVWATDAARGSFDDSGHIIGFGNLTSSVAVPTGVTLTATGSGTVSAAVPSATYGVIVQAQDSAGRWTDPKAFYTDAPGSSFAGGVATAVVSGSQKLVAACAAVTGAVRYRFSLAYYYFGARYTQQIETASTSVDFTTSPAFGVDSTASNITTGATVPQNERRAYYRVAAELSDGLTAYTADGTYMDRGPLRPSYPQWLAVTGAIRYWVERSDAGVGEPAYAFTRRWKVDASQLFLLDDFTDAGVEFVSELGEQGAAPTHDTGDEVFNGINCMRLVVSVGVCRIQNSFVSDLAETPTRVKADESLYGTVIFCPGKTGWGRDELYRSLGGRWCTVLYIPADHPIALAHRDGTCEVTVNLCGLSEHATGFTPEGDPSPVIASLVRQQMHFINNFALGVPWESGEWKAIETIDGIPLLCTSSAETVKTQWEAIIDGGLLGAWGIGVDGSFVTFDDFLRACARNAGIRWHQTQHGQMAMTLLDPSASPIATFTDRTNIYKGPAPTFKPRSVDLVNDAIILYARQYITPVTKPTPDTGALLPPKNADTTEWLSGEIPVPYAASVARHNGVKKTERFEYEQHRNGVGPTLLTTRQLIMLGDPLKRYGWTTGLAGFDLKLGRSVLFSHLAGASSATSGDTNRKIAVESIALNCDVIPGAAAPGLSVSVEGLDVTDLTL